MATPHMHATLEVPVDSIEAAVLADEFLGTGDRLELCDDLASEGWTPRPDLVQEVRRRCKAGIVAMIRPRLPGARRELDVAAFLATPAVMAASRREIEASAAAGADSVAIGLLTRDGRVDLDACGELAEHARSMGLIVAFLRTFDLLEDRVEGMRAISSLGMARVVTAGVLGWDAGVASLEARCGVLARDVALATACAGGRPPVEIVPGGGVRASNAASFLKVSPHLHASCRRGGVISRDEVTALRQVLGPAAIA